jgi:hypothetical protein
MVDIKTIPIDELKKDLQDSYDDIKACENALIQVNFFGYRFDKVYVEERLNKNKFFVKVITAELERREKEK